MAIHPSTKTAIAARLRIGFSPAAVAKEFGISVAEVTGKTGRRKQPQPRCHSDLARDLRSQMRAAQKIGDSRRRREAIRVLRNVWGDLMPEWGVSE